MKTMCPPDYHHNGFVATHALGQPFSIIKNISNCTFVFLKLLEMKIVVM